jgi:hypothetical protein
MMSAIRHWYENEEDWMSSLSEDRRKILDEQMKVSLAQDGFIDLLLFTQFGDYPMSRSPWSCRMVARSISEARGGWKFDCERFREGPTLPAKRKPNRHSPRP